MKMVAINILIPHEIDRFFRKEATRRTLSKSDVMREVLKEHVREHGSNNAKPNRPEHN